jgi:hypothetical protein
MIYNDVPAESLRRAAPALVALGIAVVLVGGVYYSAQYLSKSKTTTAPTAPWQPPVAGGQVEANGIEGVLLSRGLLVTALDGPGRGLGLQVGDVVKSVNGKPVRSQFDLMQVAQGAKVRVERDTATLELKAGTTTTMAPVDVRTIEARGLTGQLTPEGLWVTAVEGQADAWGLRVGDLVRNVDGNPLTVRRDAATMLRTLDPVRGFTFEIVRDGARLYLPYSQAGVVPSATPPQAQQVNWQQNAPVAAAGFATGFVPAMPYTGAPLVASTMPFGGMQAYTLPQAGAAGAGGTVCPACGAVHGPGWRRGSCWRCGAMLGAANPNYVPAAQPFAAAGAPMPVYGYAQAPIGPCGQPMRRFAGGWQ